ncbi:MAG: hypothetical protein ACFB02_11505 [Mastigocoleus sp.]
MGKVNDLGVDYWLAGLRVLGEPDATMSKVVLGGIESFCPPKQELFLPEAPVYFVAASAVVTPEAESETQGEKAKRLGRKLLVSAGKKDRSWVDKNLRLEIFSSKNIVNLSKYSNNVIINELNSNNFGEVAYASSRMLHGWEIPAWIEGKPYVDASYTCLCPVIEMVEAGYQRVIAISNEPGILSRDMFGLEEIPENYRSADIHIVRPDMSSTEFGVDFTSATPSGLSAFYQHGIEKAEDVAAKLEMLV